MLTPPIPVALPLLIAALLAIAQRFIPRWLSCCLAILTAAVVACVGLAMVVYSRDASIVVYWFGGWTPRPGALPGIAFVIDNTGAMLVLLASLLTTAVLLYAWHFYETYSPLFDVMLLVMLGAINGFSQTGDLLNLFLFYELMTIAAVAVCAYEARGAVSLAVSHGAGAVLVLIGIGLVYAKTGALNMALAGRRLESGSDAVVWLAFALLACGFFTKAAVAPFHFWLPGTQLAAPIPVSAVLAGATLPVGLYGFVRVYWTVFSGALGPDQNTLRYYLAILGAFGALFAAWRCYGQRDLRRMLAFAAASHMGVLLLAIGLFTPESLAGASIYVMGYSMLMGALFLGAGILLHRLGSADELDLLGRGRHLRPIGALFFLSAAGLAGIPPFCTFWGNVMMRVSSGALAHWCAPVVGLVAAAITSGALFRFAGRVFFGWGPHHAEVRNPVGQGYTPGAMYGTMASLVILGFLAGLAPRLTGAAEAAAIHVEDRAGYAQRVLDLATAFPPAVHDFPAGGWDIVRAAGALAAGLLLAWLSLCSARFRRLLPSPDSHDARKPKPA